MGRLCLQDSGSRHLQKGHGGGTDGRGSRGTRAPCQGPGYSWGQPELSLWPPELAGRGMVLTYRFFTEAWVQTQPEELAAAPEVLSLQQK